MIGSSWYERTMCRWNGWCPSRTWKASWHAGRNMTFRLFIGKEFFTGMPYLDNPMRLPSASIAQGPRSKRSIKLENFVVRIVLPEENFETWSQEQLENILALRLFFKRRRMGSGHLGRRLHPERLLLRFIGLIGIPWNLEMIYSTKGGRCRI